MEMNNKEGNPSLKELDDQSCAFVRMRRHRGSNFTNSEKSLLVKLVQEHITKTRNSKIKASGWVAICKQYNSSCNIRTRRDRQQLKKCWSNVRERTRKEELQEDISPASGNVSDIATDTSTECTSHTDHVASDWKSLITSDYASQSATSSTHVTTDEGVPTPKSTREIDGDLPNTSVGSSLKDVFADDRFEKEAYEYELQKLRTNLTFLRKEHKLKMENMQLQRRILDKVEMLMLTKV